MSTTTKRICLASALAGSVVLLCWLSTSEASPFHHYFLYHPALSNLLAVLNLPAILAGVVASGNVHQPSELVTAIAVFAQWFGIGYLIAVIVVVGRRRQ